MPSLAASATIASGVPGPPLPSPRAELKKATEKLAIDTSCATRKFFAALSAAVPSMQAR